MVGYYHEYNFGGHKYVHEVGCMYDNVYYIKPDGKREEITVHECYMSPFNAMKLHALNMNGYAP